MLSILLPCKGFIIIADGLKGTDYSEIPIDGEYCKAPKIGRAIADADIFISMNHFKGHEQAGFGGALKNIGMGSASAGGKLELHSTSQPKIVEQTCKACGVCVKHCAHAAIKIVNKCAVINYHKCVGCGQCVALATTNSRHAIQTTGNADLIINNFTDFGYENCLRLLKK